VATALKPTLLGNVAAKIELGGTHNPAAFDAYLRALKAYGNSDEAKDTQTAIDAYTEAIRLDANYALAYAGRALALNAYALSAMGPGYRQGVEKMESDARRALALAPDLAEGHWALGLFLRNYFLDFTRAIEEYERAVALAPGNAQVLKSYGVNAVYVGRTEAGVAACRRAVVLDPLSRVGHGTLAEALYRAHQYDEAVGVLQAHLALNPDDSTAHGYSGLTYYALGKFESARASCEAGPRGTEWVIRPCLAVTYDKLGRHADAEAVLANEKALEHDADAYQYAEVYAQWGNIAKALEWLETAQRLRDAGLIFLKTDQLLDPLRNEPRFQAIERALKFPN